MGKGSGGAGVDGRAAEHTAQTIHHRLTTTLASQRPEYAGERTERIGATLGLGAVRHLTRYHRPSQRSLCPVVRRLYPSIVQKAQQVPTVIVPAKLVLQPPAAPVVCYPPALDTRETGIHRNTVRKYLKTDSPPMNRPRVMLKAS